MAPPVERNRRHARSFLETPLQRRRKRSPLRNNSNSMAPRNKRRNHRHSSRAHSRHNRRDKLPINSRRQQTMQVGVNAIAFPINFRVNSSEILPESIPFLDSIAGP